MRQEFDAERTDADEGPDDQQEAAAQRDDLVAIGKGGSRLIDLRKRETTKVSTSLSLSGKSIAESAGATVNVAINPPKMA
jgi:hypothetical protein